MRGFVLALLVALGGCGLTNVQKVKLACAESAEGLGIAYRVTASIAPEDKRGDVLRGIAAADAARAGLCTATLYSAVENGTADVPALVSKIVAITVSVATAIAPYVGGR